MEIEAHEKYIHKYPFIQRTMKDAEGKEFSLINHAEFEEWINEYDVIRNEREIEILEELKKKMEERVAILKDCNNTMENSE